MRTTTKLAISSIKAGKTRSILTGIAILLTTMLITVIALGGSALIREQKDNAAENFGEYYGIFNHASPEEIEKVTLHHQFYELGFQTYAGTGICKGYDLTLTAISPTLVTLTHIQPESGTMPEKETDILAQREFFEALGVTDPRIGDTVTLPLRINGEGEITDRQFVICGFLTSSKANNLAKRYVAHVSETFIEANLPDENDRNVVLCFKVLNDENLNDSQMKEKIYSLAEELGIEKSRVSVNDKYLSWALDPGTEIILPCACIILIIMIVSALVIYNIFHVVIVQKIREYGRLKALGASKRQLRQMVRMEGILLSCVSVPAGVLLGILVLKAALYLLLQKNLTVFSLPIAMLIVLLTVCTISVSMHKPLKLVAKASPVEAIRYEAGGRELKRKGKTHVTVFGLTMSNLSLHRKRTLTTILTMGLSCVLFVIVANVVGNMDGKRQVRHDLEYGKFKITLDAALDDQTYPENNLYELQKQSPLGEDFIEKIRAIDGVTDVYTRKIMEVYETNENTGKSFYTSIAVVDEKSFGWLVSEAARGTVDYQNTASQDGIIYMWDHFLDDEYQIGDTYQCEILDGDRRVSFTAPILGSCGYSNDASMTITEDTFQKLGIHTDMTGVIFVDCTDDAEASVGKELAQLIDSSAHLTLVSFEDSLQLMNLQLSFMKNACYTFLVILGAIGFMNMANTMSTNILTRKREFGVMQAIGMSNRQLNAMLQLEGLIFTVGILFVSLTLGSVLGYYAFLYCKKMSIVGIFEYHFPLPEIAALVIGIAALQTILALALSKNVKKESLVERIRYIE